MNAVLIDTNIVILHLTGQERFPFDEIQTHIATVSIFELYQFPTLSANEKRHIEMLINMCTIAPLDIHIAIRAGELVQRRRSSKGEIDMLIAATALEYDIPLITKNVKDFARIPDLDVRKTV
ncbi:MAG: hypothetical protein COV60_00775 [Candidatus Magasanikbacteria bacterium CG11_big_fil_rev_8_21_14_0_20_43_7]|uniref:PIN domain-containing protein n=1 Tax=Candidatus Magasanikbacteria bacterium CG11_big_fil_rev_8_21_14_0_20_43_7 TaxID=1974654 RepID=A0A2H0N371_9BACT|nr:MAG: hypothetical protein COV60_00775 [Candidatus Magasanikbacteria bacterium CG11_big_fil_rev_8_21_14_0_20_43_7]